MNKKDADTIKEIIIQLANIGASLYLDEGKLKLDAKKGKIDSSLLEKIKVNKDALIEFLTDTDSVSAFSQIAQVNRGAPLNLSYPQQRLWFLDQLEGKSPTYNIPGAILLKGRLDRERAEYALRSVVERHEVLRTVYREVDGDPKQIVLPQGKFSLGFEDRRDEFLLIEQFGKQAYLEKLAGEYALSTFDLSQDLMLRVKLIFLEQHVHLMLINMHHIASDGWSTNILVGEFLKIYLEGKGALEPLAIQYGDYAEWQRKKVDEHGVDSHIEFWREQLAGVDPVLNLPFDRARPAVQSFNGDQIPIAIDSQMVSNLKRLAQDHNASLYMVLLAVFQYLLSYYSRSSDIAVGSPVANRENSQLESLIGFFVNTLVFRVDVDKRETFVQLLEKVKTASIDAFSHQDIPFEQVVDTLKPERSLSYQPFFQNMFSLLNVPMSHGELGELTVEKVEIKSGVSKFDMHLSMVASGDEIEGFFEYRADLFDRSTIQKMWAHYLSLLQHVTTNPNIPIWQYALISDDERSILNQWNETDHKKSHEPVTAQFEKQADLMPDSIAIFFKGEAISYSELNNRSNQVANYLVDTGVQVDQPVGLSFKRSPDMLIGLLGILKAGACYVALDPSYPSERIHTMIEEANVSLILADEASQDKVGSSVKNSDICDLLVIDNKVKDEIHKCSISKPDVSFHAVNSAYITFTSGSTGRPKGSILTHFALSNLLHWQIAHYPISEGEACLQFTTVNFDVSFQEIFGTLSCGGKLVMVSEEERHDPEAIIKLMNEASVSYLFCPVIVLQQLSEYCQAHDIYPKRLQVVVTAGDALRVSKEIVWLFEQLPDAQLHNHYGPSETHVVTASRYTPKDKPWPDLPHIGKPVSGCTAYIVDEYMQRVPIGVPGELYIGGNQIYRGYCGRPEQTAAVCLPDPFSGQDGARLYKTGDLVRYLPDGNIQYLSRIDSQVKIRGFRIELGEVELLLSAHELVKNVVVLARESSETKEKYLVAYLVLARESDSKISQMLRTFLKSKLPDYMVPSYFLSIDEIPKTKNGKIDRRALPEPSLSTEGGESYMAPVSDMEHRVASLFGEVLGLGQVSRDGHFFELGGHSLKATKLITRLREQLVGELSVQLLFEYPTVLALSSQIEDYPEREYFAIARADRSQPIPLSYPQQRLWFLSKLQGSESSAYSMPLVLRVMGAFDVERARRSLLKISDRHEILRTTFKDEGSVAQQIIHAQMPPELNSIDISSSSSDFNIENYLKAEIARPFDLGTGPLLRLNVVSTGSDEHYLLFNMHHIISDGWSINNLCAEFCQFYGLDGGNETFPANELSLHYADFSVWQRDWLETEEANTQLRYWQDYLKGLPECINLPLDYPRPEMQSYRGKHIPIEISKSLSDKLENYSKEHGVSLFMTLISAFSVLLYRWSGEKDVAIGSALAGRTRTELEPLIGFFANLWVLRSDLSGNIKFLDVLKTTKGNTLKAYSNQMLPFDLVVDAVQPKRSLAYSPVFQVMFLLHNNSEHEYFLEGMSAENVDIEFGIAKHDLSVNLWPSEKGIFGAIEYASDLFKEDTISELSKGFRQVLTQICEDTDVRINEFNIGVSNNVRHANNVEILTKGVKQALLHEASIHDCAILNINESGLSALVSYVVCRDDREIIKTRRAFEEKFPPVFWPKAWVQVTHIPLTKNGAIDEPRLRKLPVMSESELAFANSKLGPFFPDSAYAIVNQASPEAQKIVHISDIYSNWHWLSGSSELNEYLSSEDKESYHGCSNDAYAFGGELTIAECSPETLTEALIETANKFPSKGIHFILSDEKQYFLSYPDLLENAKTVLGGLKQSQLSVGDAVILQLENTRDHLVCFWACVLGGFRPVTVAIAPSYAEKNGVVDKLYNIWKLLDHPLVLTNRSLEHGISQVSTIYDMEALKFGVFESLVEMDTKGEIYDAKPNDVVFYQLTSGSTGVPKCIQETHKGIIHHIHGSARYCGYQCDDVSLNWLPMDHVVPILTFHLKGTFLGLTQVELATQWVLQQPLIWLDFIEKFSVTHSWSPNFGYKLLAEALSEDANNARDLSSVKTLMNAGEQVTLPVVEKFLRLVKPFGMTQEVMQPSFGMAEACTCMTYQNAFTCRSGVRYFKKSSLTNHLQPTGSDDKSGIGFIDLGGPMPGIEIRIVDGDNELLSEGQIGRFQIRGAVITPGYYRNPKANEEAFVGDDWFDSGDLGFIWDGRLTLTGRAKETIIINGANFYCYEIEDVVNAVEGVIPTFSAAVSVSNEKTSKEAIAIFFCPKNSTSVPVDLIKKIKGDVTKTLGVSPSYIIPIDQSDFPKTTSGKIQRVKLKQALLAGEYSHQLKEIDLALENENTMPNWFYQEVWVKKAAEFVEASGLVGPYWVFTDGSKEINRLCAWLREKNVQVMEISIGGAYTKKDENRCEISPFNTESIRELLPLGNHGLMPKAIVYAWLGARKEISKDDVSYVNEALTLGIATLNGILSELDRARVLDQRVSLMVTAFSKGSNQEVFSDYAIGSLDGWLSTANSEWPALETKWLNVTSDSHNEKFELLKQELNQVGGEHYRYFDGNRYSRRFVSADLCNEKSQTSIEQGGFYIVSGGLGGVGLSICQWLLSDHNARLLVLGRPVSDAREKLAHREKALKTLCHYDESVVFAEVDLTDRQSLETLVSDQARKWGCPSGVFHLAGAYHESTIRDENPHSISAGMCAKVVGGYHLFHVLQANRIGQPSSGEGIFVSMSSALSYFPSAGISSYAAANSFLNYFSDYINQGHSAPIKSYCLVSSNWNATGMSENIPFRNVIEQRGFHFMQPDHALISIKAILSQAPGTWIFGIDMNKAHLRSNLLGQEVSLERASLFLEEKDEELLHSIKGLEAIDYFDRPVRLTPVVVDNLPVNTDGKVDILRLQSSNSSKSEHKRKTIIAPRTSVERKLVGIWQDVLGIENISVEDNFFELGGNSILAVTLLGKINQSFRQELDLAKLFHSQTIETLALHLEEDKLSAWNPIVTFNSQGDKPPLFLIHPGGGWVTSYQTLNTELQDDQPVYGIQAKGVVPGLGSHQSIEEMASAYADAIKKAVGSQSCHVAGWSLGAIIAFETVKCLQTEGVDVDNLFLIDSAPHPMDEEDEAILDAYDDIEMLIQLSTDTLEPYRQRIAQMTSKDRVQWVYEHLVEIGQVPKETGVEHLESLRDEAIANTRIRRRGVTESILEDVNTVLIVSSEVNERAHGRDNLGWEVYISGEFDRHHIDGRHHKLMESPHVEIIATILGQYLS